MNPSNTSAIKGGKSLGRSVEEVFLRRKLMQATNNANAPSKTTALPLLKLKQAAALDRKQSNRGENGADVSDSNIIYTEEDVRKMMDEVMKYCRSLQNRVQVLEGQLVVHNSTRSQQFLNNQLHTTEKISSATFASDLRFPPISAAHRQTLATSNPNSRPNTGSYGNAATFVPTNPTESRLIQDIDKKVLYLKEIFRQKDPLEERILAAIKIQATIRGYLARVRKQYYQQAIVEWKILRCRPVIWLLDILLQEQAHLDAGMSLITMNRTIHTLYSIFTKWAAIYRQNIPLRRKIKALAEERITQQREKLLKLAFEGFRAVSVGLLSRKHANNERQLLLDNIRKEISINLKQRGLIGIVPPEEVETMLLRKVVEVFHQRKNQIILKFKFNAIKDLVLKAKGNTKRASFFRFRKTAGMCFYAWSDYVYLISMGLDRKRWPGPRKYEVRYNQKQVDYFTQIRIEKLVFGAWKLFFAKQKKVKVFRIKLLTKRVMQIVGAWRELSKYYRSLRRLAYENWVGYARLIMSGPFSAWADFVRGQRNRSAEHLRIAKSYIRWKSRQKLSLILRTWRHQAVFGRIDGLYTRQMLLKTVSEQKIFITSLEKTMADQVLELEDCKQVVLTEIEKRKSLEQDMQQVQADFDKTRMQIHHYEEELKRLWSVLEAMKLIHPKPLEHLLSLQFNEFKFKERLFSFMQDVPPMQINNANVGSSVPPPNPQVSNLKQSEPPATSSNNNSKVVSSSIDKSPAGGRSRNGSGKKGNSAPVVPGGPPILDDSSVEGSVTNVENDDNVSLGGDIGGDLMEENVVDVVAESNITLKTEIDSPKGKHKSPASDTDDGGDEIDEDFAHSEGLLSSTTRTPPEIMTNGSGAGLINFGQGDSIVKKEDMKLLERLQWLITRYKHSLPEDPAGEEDANNDNLVQGEGNSIDANSVGSRNSESLVNDVPQEIPSIPGVTSSPKLRNKNNLLRNNNPFLKSKSQDDVPVSPTNKLSLRSSFTRYTTSTSFINGVSNPTNNAFPDPIVEYDFPNVGNQSGAPPTECYYSNEELEDIVITWAKMLFTFLEFLETGDITNLPQEDKRLWAQFLLEQAHRQNEIPYEVFTYGHGETNGDGTTNPLQHAIQQALITVDERMHGGMSWREALLTLRTMFPGAGNFSGFGVGLENPHDTALFTRLLRMRGELRKIEDYQQQRYQARFLKSMGLPASRAANGLASTGGKMFSMSEMIVHNNSIEEEDDQEASHNKPLGTNIYASNLQKLGDDK